MEAMKPARAWFASAALFGIIVTGAAELHAQPSESASTTAPSPDALEEARQRYQRGLQLYSEGAFENARIELQRAYELAPTYRILYNIGLVSMQMRDYASALNAFERYLADGGEEIPEERRTEVQNEIEKMRARVARIEVQTNVPGADIAIDDLPIGKSPLPAPLVVNAGKRKISATREGYNPASRVLTLGGTDSVRVELELKEFVVAPPIVVQRPPPAAEAPPSTAAQPAAPPPPAPSYTWVGWAATGTLAAGAAVTGILAWSNKNDLSDKLDAPGEEGVSKRNELDDAHSKTTTLGIVTDILAGAALVTAGITLYVTLSGEDPPRDASVPATVRVGVAGNRVGVVGSF